MTHGEILKATRDARDFINIHQPWRPSVRYAGLDAAIAALESEPEPLAVGWLHEMLYVGGELVGARFRSEGAHQMYKTIEPDAVPVTVHERKPDE